MSNCPFFHYVSVWILTVGDQQAVSPQDSGNEEFQLHQSNSDCSSALLNLASDQRHPRHSVWQRSVVYSTSLPCKCLIVACVWRRWKKSLECWWSEFWYLVGEVHQPTDNKRMHHVIRFNTRDERGSPFEGSAIGEKKEGDSWNDLVLSI